MGARSIIRKIKGLSWWQIILLILVVAFSYYGYLFLNRSNFSGSDVIISIEGPDSFKAQEKIEFKIKVVNGSKTALDNGELYITLPDFMAFEDRGISGGRIDFGSLEAGKEISRNLTLFSKETQKQGVIKVRAEYTPRNLQGRFESTARLDLSAKTLPLTVIFDIPQKAVSGQRLRASFHFVAEKNLEVLPLIVRIILPEDFTLRDAEPRPKETTTWEFDKIVPRESYEVEFEGIIRGLEGEKKNFDLLFGTAQDETGFAEQYKISRTVNISLAPLQFTQTVNGSDEYVASPGERLKFSIAYENKSGVDIEDVVITSQLIGDAFDLNTLDTGSGYFNSKTKRIIWNKDFLYSLASLDEEEKGSVEFYVSLKDEISSAGYITKNISVKNKAIIDSNKIPLALKGLSLRAENIVQVKLRTSLELSSKAYYYEGPFSNSGPIPPRVGEETTYTIVWQARNSLNEVNNVRIEAPLPRHAVFSGKVYPASSSISYNSETHSILWTIDTVSPGTGNVLLADTVAFKVSLTPEERMRGAIVELVEQAKISGTDTFVEEFVEAFAPAIDTTLPEDVGIQEGDGVVG